MLRQARDRIVPRRLRASRSLSASLASIARHRYLTDGTNLYRFIGWSARGGFAELEDCRSLELVTVSPRELRSEQLRPVAPAEG
ncbi:MAG TPA: hypothetical protein VMD79_06090 [Solirubrobacteraceae bacterium]|nr:hypothetical protein [Solirubrobacteraceae bacterium]